ncbi:MAG: TonB-dependent receptor [Gemmatimonadetes bacterium]|nr:TonB-dependent receptor [Gemmatimonadota bacterium]
MRKRMRRLGWGAGLALLTWMGGGGDAAAQTSGGGGALDRPARLDIGAGSLGDALEALRRSSGVALAYSPDVVPLGRSVSCACQDLSVGEALRRLLEGLDLEVRVVRNQVLIGRSGSSASTGSLTGIVREAGGARPVAAAEVHIVAIGAAGINDAASRTTVRTSLSDADGRFRVDGLPAGPFRVDVNALGYETGTRMVEVAAGQTAGVDVELAFAPIPLREMVIAPGSFGVLEAAPVATGITVTREDIEATPQIGDDVFRTLKRMPGVSTDDISTRLNVRGSTDRDLLVRLDGLELYEPYHLRDLDGALGIVDVQTLGSVDLITGGFPVEFGDKSAGVFDMRTRSAPPEGTRTIAGLSLSTLSLSSQGNFGDGRGQWLGSLRRGFLEYILAAADVEDDLDPRYWDVLGRVQYLFGGRDLVSAEVLLAGDQMGWFDDETGSRVDSDWSSAYGWLTWKRDGGGRVRVETLASVGGLSRDRTGVVENPNRGEFTPLSARVSDVADFRFAGLKQDWQIDLADDLLLKLGADLRWGDGEYDYTRRTARLAVGTDRRLFVAADSAAWAAQPDGTELGAYVALRARLGSHLSAEAGLRYERWQHLDADGLGPRLLARWDLGRATNVRASVGRYLQGQGIQDLAIQDGEERFHAPERVDQVALGVEHRFTAGYTVRLEGYFKAVEDPRPVWVNLSREVNPVAEVEADRTRLLPDRGRARGLEAIVTRDGAGALAWSLSYAWSRAEDRIDGRWAPRVLDQTHVLNARFAWDLRPGWQLSGSWQYHTGWPFTEQILDVVVAESEDGSQLVDVIERGFGPINEGRLPAYHRLDLRMTRAFRFERSTLEVFLDVFNVYDRINLRGYEWFLQEQGGVLRAARDSGEEQLPRLPTLGVRWVF